MNTNFIVKYYNKKRDKLYFRFIDGDATPKNLTNYEFPPCVDVIWLREFVKNTKLEIPNIYLQGDDIYNYGYEDSECSKSIWVGQLYTYEDIEVLNKNRYYSKVISSIVFHDALIHHKSYVKTLNGLWCKIASGDICVLHCGLLKEYTERML